MLRITGIRQLRLRLCCFCLVVSKVPGLASRSDNVLNRFLERYAPRINIHSVVHCNSAFRLGVLLDERNTTTFPGRLRQSTRHSTNLALLLRLRVRGRAKVGVLLHVVLQGLEDVVRLKFKVHHGLNGSNSTTGKLEQRCKRAKRLQCRGRRLRLLLGLETVGYSGFLLLRTLPGQVPCLATVVTGPRLYPCGLSLPHVIVLAFSFAFPAVSLPALPVAFAFALALAFPSAFASLSSSLAYCVERWRLLGPSGSWFLFRAPLLHPIDPLVVGVFDLDGGRHIHLLRPRLILKLLQLSHRILHLLEVAPRAVVLHEDVPSRGLAKRIPEHHASNHLLLGCDVDTWHPATQFLESGLGLAE